MAAALDRINHIVVLMLENRSFDSLLGRLYPPSAGFNGLTGLESNPGPDGRPVAVWNSPGTGFAAMTTPDPDPGELWVDINTQLFGTPDPPQPSVATMSGFVKNYLDQASADPPGRVRDPKAVMHYFTPDQVPVLSRLARQFAVCDQWHAAAPCQTWPNRFFAHTGTANGYENNSPTHFPYPMKTIFTRFNDFGRPDDWRVYFHDVPQALTLQDLWAHPDGFRLYPEFRRDAASGELPAYAFIEPRYFPDADLPNDQHPPHDVTLGEQLIADVYNALRNGPKWTETLLLITYDEHGGCFDHVPPPPAEPPDASPGRPFDFSRYGVRVPAVVVSPYVAPGSVLRAPPGSAVFDHTSIIATVRARFGLGAPLSRREALAPTLESALSLPAPTNLGPDWLEALPFAASPADVALARLEPVNGMQAALTRLAQHLQAISGADDIISGVVTGAEAWLTGEAPARADALQTVRDGIGAFFRSA